MGRPTKLNSQIQKKIVTLLRRGVTVADACSDVGISPSTFYLWIERGNQGEIEFSEFSEAVSRAYVAAKVKAIGTLHAAMSPFNQTATTTKTFTETRVNPKTGEEYIYTRTEESRSVTRMQGDWRAALEFLKRRFPEEWVDRLKVDDWHTEIVQLLRNGQLSPDKLREELPDLAEELIDAAGISETSS